ncbi:transporter substrate-binding domain-containing protein [Caenispirillum salinarum]|uniref:transporter substrate-binding domain-containing protein n=1 Tax=Caenispirillum salinarum TaxID=859058 RepID=UPI0012671B0A|nr:transporter substrate-binding domain-containing protein [Caenispirillum salinarum]
MDNSTSPHTRWRRFTLWLAGAVAVAGIVLAVMALTPDKADAAGTAPTAAAPAPVQVAVTAASARDGGTVDAIRRRGTLRCGVGAVSEYAWRDDTGRMRGFRADFCRALAAVVLDSPDAVEFVSLIASTRFKKLQDGSVDVLVAGVTWTMTREADVGLAFTTPILYDGQGFIARRGSGMERLDDVTTPARVCVIADTTTERNLKAYIRETGLPLTVESRHTQDGTWSAFLSRSCDLITGDRLSLMLARAVRTPDADDYLILPDMISREPLTPAVRGDDPRWESIVRFTIHALLLAEHVGVDQARAAADDAQAETPEARRLLGLDRGAGAAVGLDDAWARRAIATAGHYGELFERTLGNGSRFGLPRGLNALWTDGGLHYPLPLW